MKTENWHKLSLLQASQKSQLDVGSGDEGTLCAEIVPQPACVAPAAWRPSSCFSSHARLCSGVADRQVGAAEEAFRVPPRTPPPKPPPLARRPEVGSGTEPGERGDETLAGDGAFSRSDSCRGVRGTEYSFHPWAALRCQCGRLCCQKGERPLSASSRSASPPSHASLGWRTL